MAKDRQTDDKAPREAAKPGAAPAPVDERDLKIERLERALAEEKAHAQTLREGSDALRFKLEILEKSYSKQLADARQRADAATKELATLKAQIAEFGKGGEDTLKAVSEMRTELLNVTAERNHLREQLAKGGGPSKSYGGRSYASKPVDESSDTINALITSASLQGARERDEPGDGILNARVKLEQGPSEVMVSPDEIFTDKDKDDDEKNAA
jgi:serine phosphatase RsbU (regulator of sigma subunit)